MQNNESVQPLPEIFIGGDAVKTRVDQFLKEKYPLLINAQKSISHEREETKSIWYSKVHIETWLNEINLLNADGMRIHFGTYGDDSIAPGQLCLLMTLTRPSQSGSSHEDIIYENEPDFTDRKNATAKSRSIADSANTGNSKPKPFNYGSPCPPIC